MESSSTCFLRSLVRCGEKAAIIARKCRSVKELNRLLVQEKTGSEKNKPFVEDFKTLADVLIQATIRRDITQEFPSLAGHILGEESTEFTNATGETIEIVLTTSRADTMQMLLRALNGNEEAAKALVDAVHAVLRDTEVDLCGHVFDHVDLPLNDLALWIDPIDNTASYIRAFTPDLSDKLGMHVDALQCVVVVIGAFQRTTGRPLVGVVNQPFFSTDKEGLWTGRCVWGISCGPSQGYNSLGTGTGQVPTQKEADESLIEKRVVLSRSEVATIVDKLQEAGFESRIAMGAGYKLLCVIDRLVSVFLVSRDSTFKWDTCGADAILRSMGGGVLRLKSLLESESCKPETCLIRYDKPDVSGLDPGQLWRNDGGIVAVCNFKYLDAIRTVLR